MEKIGDEWRTPTAILEKVQIFFGKDFLDPASSEEGNKTVKASLFYDKEANGLTLPWKKKVWLNPPYSRPLCLRFTEKLIEEMTNGNVEEALVLVNAATETKWYQLLGANCCLRLDFNERLKFWHPDQTDDRPRYPQSLFYFSTTRDKARMNEFMQLFHGTGSFWREVKTRSLIERKERHKIKLVQALELIEKLGLKTDTFPATYLERRMKKYIFFRLKKEGFVWDDHQTKFIKK